MLPQGGVNKDTLLSATVEVPLTNGDKVTVKPTDELYNKWRLRLLADPDEPDDQVPRLQGFAVCRVERSEWSVRWLSAAYRGSNSRTVLCTCAYAKWRRLAEQHSTYVHVAGRVAVLICVWCAGAHIHVVVPV